MCRAMDRYFTLKLSIDRNALAGPYHVELSHTLPGSAAETAPAIGTADFDRTALLEHELMPLEYGRALTKQLFAAEAIRQRFIELEASAQTQGKFYVCR